MDLEKYFPLAFEEIRKLMAHGATTHRDDQEWREHGAGEHLLDHVKPHIEKIEHGDFFDGDSGQPQLTHVACRALMALEVFLGGAKCKNHCHATGSCGCENKEHDPGVI